MAIEVFTILKSPNAHATSSFAQNGPSELVHYSDIHRATQFALISMPLVVKSLTTLTASFLEHNDVPNTKRNELRLALNTLEKHANDLESLNTKSRKLLANLDDARMFFVLSYNASIKLDDSKLNPEITQLNYQRNIESFQNRLEQSNRESKGFVDDFERFHQFYGDTLFEEYQKIMMPASSMYVDRVFSRVNRIKYYLDPIGPFFQAGNFLHGAFAHTPRINIVNHLNTMASLLEADAKTTLFSDIPGFSQQILALRGSLLFASIALGTNPSEYLNDEDKTRIGDLQTAFTRLFTVDFPVLHRDAMSDVVTKTEGRFRSFDASPAELSNLSDTPLINARNALWETHLKRLCQNSATLLEGANDFYLSLEISKIKTIMAETATSPAYRRGTFSELISFFSTQVRIAENISSANINTQCFACSPYLWPKELLHALAAMRTYSNAVIAGIQQLHTLLLSIITIVEARPATAWHDHFLSAREKDLKITVHVDSINLKKQIAENCRDYLNKFISIQTKLNDVWFNSEEDFKNRARLFILAEPPTDYTKDVSGRKKIVISLRNPIEVSTLVLFLKYYNFLARIRDTKVEIVPINSHDLRDATKLAELNARLSNVFAASKTALLTQFIFLVDDVYLIGGCIREIGGNYKLIVANSYVNGTIPRDLFVHMSGICSQHNIIFDTFSTIPQFCSNHAFAAIEAIAYLSRQDFNPSTLMTSDNNDGFTAQNLSRHLRCVYGGRIINEVVNTSAVNGMMAQLAQIDQYMTAFNTAERIYRFGLRNRWARLIQTASQDFDFKNYIDAGIVFQETISSITVAPPIENPAVTAAVDQLNLFPLVPSIAIERMEAQRRMRLEQEHMARMEVERRTQLESDQMARLEKEVKAKLGPQKAASIPSNPSDEIGDDIRRKLRAQRTATAPTSLASDSFRSSIVSPNAPNASNSFGASFDGSMRPSSPILPSAPVIPMPPAPALPVQLVPMQADPVQPISTRHFPIPSWFRKKH